MRFLVGFSRCFVGLLFIVSGGIKANDALGFSYKLEEYFDVFNQILTLWEMDALANLMDFFSDLALPMAMFICVFEIVLGVATILGVKVKAVMWNMLLMILFFTWLTGYTATCDPANPDNISCVSDCGCFGDAIPLTPVQSFYKDLILLFFIVILFVRMKDIKPVLEKRESNIILLLSIVFPTIFTIYTYRHLPVKDFRVYKSGVNLMDAMNGKPGKNKMYYQFEELATGKEVVLPAFPPNFKEKYKYITHQDSVIIPAIEPTILDFSIMDEVLVDQKGIFINDSTTTLILISKGLGYLGEFTNTDGVINGFVPNKGVKEQFELVNKLAENSEKKGIHFLALCSNLFEEMDEFKNEMQSPFTYYTGDEKMIKTIIRSNPGLMLVNNGVIIKKWHINDFPDIEEVEEYLK